MSTKMVSHDVNQWTPVGGKNTNIRKRKQIQSPEKNLKTICITLSHL